MKIIIIGTAHPYRGGLATFNERLAAEFVREGHKVEIQTFTLQYPAFLFPGKTQFSVSPAPENLKISRKINSINPFNWLKVGREMRKQQPDLVIFCYWLAFVAPCFGTIAWLAKSKKTRFIGLIHNMIPHERTILDKIFPRYFVSAMNSFVTLSKSVIDDVNLFDRHNKPKFYSPHPIYDHYGTLEDKSSVLQKLHCQLSIINCQLVLFFGFIRGYKGLDLLIDAFADERIRNLNVKLLVAGEFYEDENVYLEQIKRLSLQEKIILHTHFIPDNKVADYFNAADIVVQPYKSATQSGVTQIAYHFEKPMIVTNVGGLPEIVPDGRVGYVVAPKAEKIADALVDFFENKPDFSQNIKEEKKKFAWSEMTKTILKIKDKQDGLSEGQNLNNRMQAEGAAYGLKN